MKYWDEMTDAEKTQARRDHSRTVRRTESDIKKAEAKPLRALFTSQAIERYAREGEPLTSDECRRLRALLRTLAI